VGGTVVVVALALVVVVTLAVVVVTFAVVGGLVDGVLEPVDSESEVR